MRALVVDDEANIRKSLIRLLVETEFESFQALGLGGSKAVDCPPLFRSCHY